MSKNITPFLSPLSILICQLLDEFKRARTVECRFLNPHCLVLKSLLELKKSNNCLYMILLNTLTIEGKTEMGL